MVMKFSTCFNALLIRLLLYFLLRLVKAMLGDWMSVNKDSVVFVQVR